MRYLDKTFSAAIIACKGRSKKEWELRRWEKLVAGGSSVGPTPKC